VRSTADLPPRSRAPLADDAASWRPTDAPLADDAPAGWPSGEPALLTGTFGGRRVGESGGTAEGLWLGEPVAIPVDPGWGTTAADARAGLDAWTDDGARSSGAPPPAAAPSPVMPPAASGSAAPPEAPPGRRTTSRWLPSILSRGAEPDAAGPRPIAEPAEDATWAPDGDASPGLDAAAAWAWDPPLDAPTAPDAEDGGVAPGAASDGDDAFADDAGPWRGEPEPGPAWVDGGDDLAPAAVAAAAVPPVAQRRRRFHRPGVPVDAHAPGSVAPQTSPVMRTAGSGEWDASRQGAAPRSGSRRFRPGVVPPIAVAALVLFLGAAVLFLVPGLLAGGGADATARPAGSLPTVAASRAPLAPSAAPSKGPAPTMRSYVVEQGDTLSRIARRFGISQELLICVNRELRRDPDLLSIGQELVIPPKGFACSRAGRTPAS
jgi:LysM repeat protein